MSLIFEERPSDSADVETIWRARSERPGSFTSIAATHWEMVLMHYQGQTTLTVRGPETKATPADFPAGAEWLGITFKLGSFMPQLPPGGLLDRQDVSLPGASRRTFWLQGAAWEFPTYANADTFAARLAHAGLLARDPLVEAVVHERPTARSIRAIQYRFFRATGLTPKKIQQIERARRAVALLESGVPILDAVDATGYFDQAHLTNSLKRFIGRTPAQVAQRQPTG